MGPLEAILERRGWADASMNDGNISFDGGQHRHPLRGLRRATTGGTPDAERPSRRQYQGQCSGGYSEDTGSA
jgi:hypothetical protein